MTITAHSTDWSAAIGMRSNQPKNDAPLAAYFAPPATVFACSLAWPRNIAGHVHPFGHDRLRRGEPYPKMILCPSHMNGTEVRDLDTTFPSSFSDLFGVEFTYSVPSPSFRHCIVLACTLPTMPLPLCRFYPLPCVITWHLAK